MNPLSSGRRTKLSGVGEEPDKIDKLEKSLEMLDKAIEKNNQMEFNALTDVLESDTYFDFEKDEAEDKSEPSTPPAQPARQAAGGRGGKLTLPPATNKTKMVQNQGRSTLSQVLSAQAKTPLAAATRKNGNSTLRGVPAATKTESVPASKRRDSGGLSKMSSAEGKSKQTSIKSLEYDYEDEDYEPAGEDEEGDDYDLMNKMCDEGSEDPEENSDANDATLVKYATYLDPKSSEGDLLEESQEDDEETDGPDTQRSEEEVI